MYRSLQIGPRPAPLHVTRIVEKSGSHIEPALDQDWSQPWKLEWHAAVVAHDTGLTIRLHPVVVGWLGNLEYAITLGDIHHGGQISLSALPYYDAWTALCHIGSGASALLNQQRANENGLGPAARCP